MALHVPTLLVAIFVSFALFATTLSLAWSRARGEGELRLWATGSWLLLGGLLVLVGRVMLPAWSSVLFGNGLVFTSLYTSSRALHRFIVQHEPPRWQAGLLGLAWLVVAMMLGRSVGERTVVVSLLLAAQLLAMVALIVRRGWRLEPSLRAVAVTLALGMASLLLRAVDAALHPADYQGFFQASLGNGLTYLASYLFPLGAGFGFVLANLERSTLRLQQQAMHDSLTGCVNRGTFDLLLAHACERARREGAALSMLMLDLDEFKAVNDRHGHPGGDEVLRAFAAAVRARLRGSDVFGRLGGEEFALVLPATEAVGAMRLAEDLRAAVERLAITLASGATVQVTVSLGVATAAPGAGAQPEALHARADEALYAAKHAGRNRVRAHEPAPSGADPLAGAAAAGAR